jgi:hypothetical protein
MLSSDQIPDTQPYGMGGLIEADSHSGYYAEDCRQKAKAQYAFQEFISARDAVYIIAGLRTRA